VESKVIHKWREPPEKGKKKRKKVKSHRTLVVSTGCKQCFFYSCGKKIQLGEFFSENEKKT